MTVKIHGNFGPPSEGGPALTHGATVDLSPEEEHRLVRGGCAAFVGAAPKVSKEYAAELDAMFPPRPEPGKPVPQNAVKPDVDDDDDALTADEPADDAGEKTAKKPIRHSRPGKAKK